MADLALDLTPNSPSFGDLLMRNGDLLLTQDADALGTHPVLQDILLRLKTFLGEWFLDQTLGVPWYQSILVKGPDVSRINAILKTELLQTPGVVSLDRFASSYDTSRRLLRVEFAATTTLGPVAYNGILSTSAGSL